MSKHRLHQIWKAAARIVAVAFVLLGAVILLRPATAAPIFGVPADSANDAILLRAIALRDVSFGAFLVIAPSISTRATRVFLAVVSIIPAGDFALVWFNEGISPALVPHAVSGLSLITLAAVGLFLTGQESDWGD